MQRGGGRGERLETYEKNLRWLQLLRDFHCVVTSTWVSCDTYSFHTRGRVGGGGDQGSKLTTLVALGT